MKIEMLKTASGSPDGTSVKNYEKGQVYDVPDDLAKVFVDQMKVAEIFREKDEHDPRARAR